MVQVFLRSYGNDIAARVAASRLSLAAVALVVACGGDGPTDPTSDPPVLNVRVHLLESEFAPLSTTLTDQEVEQLLASVNAIWQQAGITWELESIVRERAVNAADYERLLSGDLSPSGPGIASVLPPGSVTTDRWDVFYLRDLGGIAGGVYLPPLTAIVVAELDPTGSRDITGSVARILAHELGHSLALQHVPCAAEGNLMAPGCTMGDRERLAPGQIDVARNRAASGRPSLF
jgi:hypothetical protein